MKEKAEAPKKALEELFDQPQPSKGKTVATKLEDLQKQIEELKKQHDSLLSTERAAAIKEIIEKIKLFGLTARDLNLGAEPKAKGNHSKVAVKYKSGEHSWTGRGKQPKWVAEHIANGGTLDDLLIK